MITAAREAGDNQMYGFLLGADAASCKETVQRYGICRVVEIAGDAGDLVSRPEMQTDALIAAMKNYDIRVLVGLSSSRGRDLMARVAANLDAPVEEKAHLIETLEVLGADPLALVVAVFDAEGFEVSAFRKELPEFGFREVVWLVTHWALFR